MADWIVPLVTLTVMEIVLGIDNIIFIAIVAGRLPAKQQRRARQIGLGLALGMRLLLLLALSWILGLTTPVFHLSSVGVPESWLASEVDAISWRDVILIAGGLFLIGKSTSEIHHKLEGTGDEATAGFVAPSLGWTLAQIAVLDIVFSLDSVITAVGMVQELWIMMVAVVIAVGVMLVFAGAISDFVHRHPTLRMLALSFLILIGVILVAGGLGQHIDHGYIYFAMAFSLGVEMLNLRLRPKVPPVELRDPRAPEAVAAPSAPAAPPMGKS